MQYARITAHVAASGGTKYARADLPVRCTGQVAQALFGNPVEGGGRAAALS